MGNDLVDRETARKYVLKRAGEMALARGYEWVQVQELIVRRDAAKVTPTAPGSVSMSTNPMDEMRVQYRTSALLTFGLGHRAGDE